MNEKHVLCIACLNLMGIQRSLAFLAKALRDTERVVQYNLRNTTS